MKGHILFWLITLPYFLLLFFISTIWWWPTYFSEDLKFLIHLIFVCACIIVDSTTYSALGSCQPLLCRVLSFSLMEVDFTVVILGDSVALRSNFVTRSWYAARFSLQAWMIYTRYFNNDCYVYLYFLFCLNWEFVWYWSFIMFIFSLEFQKQFLWLVFFVFIAFSVVCEDSEVICSRRHLILLPWYYLIINWILLTFIFLLLIIYLSSLLERRRKRPSALQMEVFIHYNFFIQR